MDQSLGLNGACSLSQSNYKQISLPLAGCKVCASCSAPPVAVACEGAHTVCTCPRTLSLSQPLPLVTAGPRTFAMPSQAPAVGRENTPYLSFEMDFRGHSQCGANIFNIAIVKKNKVKKLSWEVGLLGSQVFTGRSVLMGLPHPGLPCSASEYTDKTTTCSDL